MRANTHVSYSHWKAAGMTRKTLTQPRKNASQERSRATVDALVEATARVLVKEGFDKASTNRIAEKAGVSIGSLYQYFPCKEALVAAVIDRHNEKVMRVVRAALVDVASRPVNEAVRRLVAVAIEAHRIDPRLHSVLAEQIPRTGRLKNIESFNREAHALFLAYLGAHRDELRVTDLELAAFMCASAIEGISHTAVLHRGGMSEEAAARLVDETSRLVVGYLQ
jgi:AcrR family transcriptional regulator